MQHDAKERQRMMRAARRKLGLSQADVAAELNVRQQTYGGYESKGSVPLQHRDALVKLLNLDPDVFEDPVSGAEDDDVARKVDQLTQEIRELRLEILGVLTGRVRVNG